MQSRGDPCLLSARVVRRSRAFPGSGRRSPPICVFSSRADELRLRPECMGSLSFLHRCCSVRTARFEKQGKHRKGRRLKKKQEKKKLENRVATLLEYILSPPRRLSRACIVVSALHAASARPSGVQFSVYFFPVPSRFWFVQRPRKARLNCPYSFCPCTNIIVSAA